MALPSLVALAIDTGSDRTCAIGTRVIGLFEGNDFDQMEFIVKLLKEEAAMSPFAFSCSEGGADIVAHTQTEAVKTARTLQQLCEGEGEQLGRGSSNKVIKSLFPSARDDDGSTAVVVRCPVGQSSDRSNLSYLGRSAWMWLNGAHYGYGTPVYAMALIPLAHLEWKWKLLLTMPMCTVLPKPIDTVEVPLDAIRTCLHKAAERGLLFLDIKPGNMGFDRRGRVLLLDQDCDFAFFAKGPHVGLVSALAHRLLLDACIPAGWSDLECTRSDLIENGLDAYNAIFTMKRADLRNVRYEKPATGRLCEYNLECHNDSTYVRNMLWERYRHYFGQDNLDRLLQSMDTKDDDYVDLPTLVTARRTWEEGPSTKKPKI